MAQQPPQQWMGQQLQQPPMWGPQQQVNVSVSGPGYAVTHERKQTSHGLHLFLTIITGGAWGLLVWLPLTMWHSMGPKRKVITDYR